MPGTDNSQTNKHKLSRYIPSDIRRIIRQKSGFGCVVCGRAVYQYEHVAPPFEDALEHDSDKMTLLCGTCHDYVTRGLWSKETIQTAMGNPKCLEEGFSFGPFDIGRNSSPVVVLGTITWVDTPIIIQAPAVTLLRIDPPEDTNAPFRLSGVFYDGEGHEIFRIVENEWQSPTDNWDVEIEGQRITIRRALGEIILKIRAEPPDKLVVERLDMFYKEFRIVGQEGQTTRVIGADGSTVYSFAPEIQRKIIQSLKNFSEEFRRDVLARYENDDLPGITMAECESGIVIQEDGRMIFGKGCKINPGGGGLLNTF